MLSSANESGSHPLRTGDRLDLNHCDNDTTSDGEELGSVCVGERVWQHGLVAIARMPLCDRSKVGFAILCGCVVSLVRPLRNRSAHLSQGDKKYYFIGSYREFFVVDSSVCGVLIFSRACPAVFQAPEAPALALMYKPTAGYVAEGCRPGFPFSMTDEKRRDPFRTGLIALLLQKKLTFPEVVTN
ncbi:hypothetical protein EDC15_114100 [Acetobacter aceti NBRC 14818]|nr:hypothetical protein EDC15_114100 [Acetobacter aceti NBRC 14818]